MTFLKMLLLKEAFFLVKTLVQFSASLIFFVN